MDEKILQEIMGLTKKKKKKKSLEELYPNDVIVILVPPTKREQILNVLREHFPYLKVGAVDKQGKCYAVY